MDKMRYYTIRYLVVLLSSLIIICCPYNTLYAESAKSIKIGFVDLNRVAEESLTGRALMEKFKKEGMRRQNEIDEKRKRVEELRMEIEKQGMLLSDKVRGEREAEYLREKRNLERFFSDSSEEFERKKGEAEQELLDRIIRLTKKMGIEEGYTVILSKQFLLFASDGIDLTDRIIKRIDENKTK